MHASTHRMHFDPWRQVSINFQPMLSTSCRHTWCGSWIGKPKTNQLKRKVSINGSVDVEGTWQRCTWCVCVSVSSCMFHRFHDMNRVVRMRAFRMLATNCRRIEKFSLFCFFCFCFFYLTLSAPDSICNASISIRLKKSTTIERS